MRRLVRLPIWVCAIGALLHLTAGAAIAQQPAGSIPNDADIRKLLVERVDAHRQSVGIVVGVTTPAGHRIITYGARAVGDTRPLDGDTVFEIGSITKVFTSLLLADAVQRGEVALTDRSASFCPKTVTLPQRNGRAITLRDWRHIRRRCRGCRRTSLPRTPRIRTPTIRSNSCTSSCRA